MWGHLAIGRLSPSSKHFACLHFCVVCKVFCSDVSLSCRGCGSGCRWMSVGRWRENLLHQKLYGLEKQLVLERVVEAEKGSKTIHLWRIHSKVFVAIEWRHTAMMDKLHNDLKQASKHNFLQCSNPVCELKVNLLDAASGPKALEDDHPLCRRCGFRLTTSVSEHRHTDTSPEAMRVSLSYRISRRPNLSLRTNYVGPPLSYKN